MGLYQRRGSRFWWMTYTVNEQRYFESTKTTSKAIANKIWKHREGEIALRLFKIGWPGEWMRFGQLCDEFEQSHFPSLSENTARGHRSYIANLKLFQHEPAGRKMTDRILPGGVSSGLFRDFDGELQPRVEDK